MTIDRYREQSQSAFENHKQAVLARVMESQQINLSEEMDRGVSLAPKDSLQKERIPDWFAD